MWLYLEILGASIGLLYLWFEYRASIWLWAAGIVMPAIYVFVYGHSGFYADMGINIYFLGASVYGWIMWRRGQSAGKGPKNAGKTKDRAGKANIAYGRTAESTPDGTGTDTGERVAEKGGENTGLPITSTPKRYWPMLAGITLLVFAAIAAILINFTDSTVPYGDSFTTALSIAGMWMLSRKYVEQWLVWLVVDAISAGLYIYKGLYPTAILYSLYSVIAVFGYLKWRRMMKEQAGELQASVREAVNIELKNE